VLLRPQNTGLSPDKIDYYETLEWLKQSTPDPGIDYYAFYEEPKFNTKINRIESYNYPQSAYGIMSSWDLGHMITYYAHRIPNANPFQQGVGRIKKDVGITEPGEATFLLKIMKKKRQHF